MRKKGFTLIEMLAVIIIFGVIIGIGVTSYSKYLTSSRKKSYNIAENSMKAAATDAIADCLTGNGKDREFCKNHNLVDDQYEYELVYLNELVNDDYMDSIRDPYNTDLLCSEDSYVYITNKADTNQVNNANFDYKVCLICSKYKSEACLEDIEQDSDFNAYCLVSYDSEGKQPYNGEWTDKNLYLTLTADGDFKYGISNFRYKYGNVNKSVPATNNKAVVLISNTVNAIDIEITAEDGMNQKKTVNCNTVRIDKEKILSAKIKGELAYKRTSINSGTWASEDVLLTVTTNPTKIPSGGLYQWYKDGEKIGDVTTSNTYIAKEDGIYYAEVTNTLRNQEWIKTNEFVVKIDREAPTITAIKNPLSLGSGAYNFVDNTKSTFGISGGSVKCNPSATRKTGTYNVTCTAIGDNKLTAQTTFKVQHSYAATAVWGKCTKKTNCRTESGESCTCNNFVWCNYTSGNSQSGTDTCGSECLCCDDLTCTPWSKQVCDETTYECIKSYKCPNGGTLKGTTCYY